MDVIELDDLIEDVKTWHRVRVGLNKKRGRKPLVMDTLPWVLEALIEYRAVLVARETFDIKPVETDDPRKILDQIVDREG